MAGYRVTIRRGPKVVRQDWETLDEALGAVERAVVAVDDRRDAVRWIRREIPPEQQVVARIELTGPRVRGGVDVRGDGSAEAFTGRWRRVLVEQRKRESAAAALRRTVVSERQRP